MSQIIKSYKGRLLYIPGTEEEQVTAKGLLKRAKQFYGAFNELASGTEKLPKYSMVAYFLISHAVELLLKAILRWEDKKKYTVQKFKRKYNHSLLKLMSEVEKNKIMNFSEKEKADLFLLDKHHSDYRYFRADHYKLPYLKSIRKIVERIKSECSEKINR